MSLQNKGKVVTNGNKLQSTDEKSLANSIDSNVMLSNKDVKINNHNQPIFTSVDLELKLDSSVRILESNGNVYGVIRWSGRVNGKDVYGVELDEEISHGTDGTFCEHRLFNCPSKHGILVPSNIIGKDQRNKDGLTFMESLLEIKSDSTVKCLISGKDDVYGKVRWSGMHRDGKEFYGIELDSETDGGSDGTFVGQKLFNCPKGHGILLPIKCVEECRRSKDAFISTKLISEVKLNSSVKVSMLGKGDAYGIVRWSGTHGDGKEFYGIELDEETDGGSDGTFVGQKLFTCQKGHGILLPTKFVTLDDREVARFISKEFSADERIYPNITINSCVECCLPKLDNQIYGLVRWSGFGFEGKKFYGIELEEERLGCSDGSFQNQKLFECQKGYGICLPISMVSPDKRNEDRCIMGGRLAKYDGYDKCGIECNGQTVLLSSILTALFAKSDNFKQVLFASPFDNSRTAMLKSVLSSWIVYPLRKHGFVVYRKLKAFCDLLATASSIGTDVGEVVRSIFQLVSDDFLISFSSYSTFKSTSPILSIDGTISNPSSCVSIQQLLAVTMTQNKIMFNKIPSYLILETRRSNDVNVQFNHIVPLNVIDISPFCIGFKKSCFCCADAQFQCQDCIDRNCGHMDKGLFCDLHKCSHDDARKLPTSSTSSSSLVLMELKAAICSERNRFITYVRDDYHNNWIAFENNYNEMSPEDLSTSTASINTTISKFLNSSTDEMIEIASRYASGDLGILFKNPHLLIYQNNSVTCY